MEEKREDQKWKRTHFGPEENETRVKNRLETTKCRKELLSKELRKQIEERAKQRELERTQEISIDKLSMCFWINITKNNTLIHRFGKYAKSVQDRGRGTEKARTGEA